MEGYEHIETFADYLADESRVSPSERASVEFEAELIGKMIEAREALGMTQRELAQASGVKQPSIARIETMRSTPQIDTLMRLLAPLGYKLAIVPLDERAKA